MKLKCMIPTRNVHLIWVKTRNSAVWTFKSSLQLFLVSYQNTHLFSSSQGSTNVSSKFGTVGGLIQNTEITSAELSSAYQFSRIKVFLGLSLKSTLIFHIKAHQKKEQTWSSWCWIATKDKKIKETWLGQTINNEWWKFPLHLKCCILILCVENLSDASFSKNLSLTWDLEHPQFSRLLSAFHYQGKWGFLVLFMGWSPQCFPNWEAPQTFKRLCSSEGNKGRCKLWARQRMALVCDAFCQPLNYSTLGKRMSNVPQAKIHLAKFCCVNFFILGVFYETIAFALTQLGNLFFFRNTIPGDIWYLFTLSIINSTLSSRPYYESLR